VYPYPAAETSHLAHYDAQTLISTTTRRLLKIKGFSDIKVEKIKDAAKKLSVSTSLTDMPLTLGIR
jgi:hypothetical protein